jgi:hypothetical protein
MLHGIMVLGIIGYHLLRGGAYGHRSKDSGGIVFLGLGLMVVGFVGTFFGNLIKAAVSRQREFLADGSAVQFTRNPNGIAGALMRIANHAERSYLNNPSSAEISHALFEEAKVSPLSRLYATHPSLEKRIAAIIPAWDGSLDLIRNTIPEPEADKARETELSKRQKMTAILTGATGVLVTDAVISQVGNPNANHLQYAVEIRKQISPMFLDAAREPSSARAVIYYLVLARTDSTRQLQMALLEDGADVGVYQELQTLVAADSNGQGIEPQHRLPLVEIVIASLRQLSSNQYELFRNNFSELIAVDKKMNLLEWTLQKIVFHHLDSVFLKQKPHKLGKKDLKSCQTSMSLLLSILAHSNRQKGISTDQAFGCGALKLDMDLQIVPIASIDFEALNEALAELILLKPLQKPALLKAFAACVTADQEVEPIEAELMRAIAATIDCPMPPIIV